MPQDIQTTVNGDTATIAPQNAEALSQAVKRLLEAADDPAQVVTSTEAVGPLQLKVPTEVARRAGLIDGGDVDPDVHETTPTPAQSEKGALVPPVGDDGDAQSAETEAETETETETAAPASESNAPAGTEDELTPAQKAARTRRENEARAKAEAQRKADEQAAADAAAAPSAE